MSSVSGRESELQMLSTAIKITLDLQRNVKVRTVCPLLPSDVSGGASLKLTLVCFPFHVRSL